MDGFCNALQLRFGSITLPKEKTDIADATGQITIPNDEEENEQFYRYSSGRWLFKEDEQMAKRYVRFNIQALKWAASDAIKSTCISMVKLPEGHFNKIFLLKFNNGRELIAKVPNPNAGIAHFTIASEVATLDYLRTVLNISVPEVSILNSHSSPSLNPVGAEYIIMEKVPGVELHQVWSDVSDPDRTSLVKDVVQIESKLAAVGFPKYGSLFYPDDVVDQAHSGSIVKKLLPGPENNISTKFVIGPTIERAFWADERSDMNVDRGPWISPEDYFTAVVKREIAWITSCVKQDTQADASQSKSHVELLEKFLLILPYIIPKSEDIRSPTLWHTDLHRGNIFVDSPQSPQISGIIDWQGVCIAPFFLQARFASAFDCDWDYPWGAVMPPPLQTNFDELSIEDQHNAQVEYKEVKLKKFYEVASRKFNPRLFRALDAMQIDDEHLIPSIFDLVGRSWVDGLMPLRHLLVQIALDWDKLTDSTIITCPISFSRNEIERSSKDMERWAIAYNKFHAIRSKLVGKDGWVPNDEYHDAKAQLMSHKEDMKELQAELKAAGGTGLDDVF
ncbi:hypothetical protein PVAG01_07985 [Phlyctema vagabunda]|uniref:Altered inheritance of mitochondria protein 9, mitochondrial n=1 Tax=Phlyctema vagabunda TaxID=108571 RepID=A0ABR4PDY7_9HELO